MQARTVAIADEEVRPRLLFEHERKVLACCARTEIFNNGVVGKSAERDLSRKFRLGFCIDQGRKAPLIIDISNSTKAFGL